MDFRNASSLERHTAVLDLCERAARNIETEFEKDGDSRFIADSTHEIVSKLKYLASRASAGWTAGFHNTLMLAHSIRVVRIDHESKSQLRQKPMRVKKIQEWYESKDDLASVMDQETLRNFQRNQKVIDLSFIPKEVTDQIVEEYETQSSKGNKDTLTYLVTKRCNMLIEAVQDFQNK